MTSTADQKPNKKNPPTESGTKAAGEGGRAPAANRIAEFLNPSRHREWLLGLCLVAATIIAYLPVWHAGFIWDDDYHLTNNPCIVGPLGFKEIWTSSAALYYPLVLTSFWVQYPLWGFNPLPYHLVNIAMHTTCGLLLWWVLRCLKARGAWLGAALWTLHPVQVESVAWITELKNTQSCLFFLLAIRFFLKWRAAGELAGQRGSERDYALALLGSALAILSKVSTVILPVVLGLCWWWMEGRWRRRNWLRLAPFFLISAVASGWTIWEQKFHSGANGPAWAQTWIERLVIAGKGVWFYLGKLLWPHPLMFVYPRWAIDASRPAAYLPVLAAAIGLFVLWRNRNGPMRTVGFAFAYFLVSLFPVFGFFNIYFFRYSFVGDHFQYLASIGPLALTAAGLTTGLRFLEKKSPFWKPALYGMLLVALGGLTWRQSGMFRDNETLWRTTIARNPDCAMAHNNLRFILRQREAVGRKPHDAEYYNTLGNTLLEKGEVDEAIISFVHAIILKPDDAEAHGNLGNAMLRPGQSVEEAITYFQAAIKLRPDNAPFLNNLAWVRATHAQARFRDGQEAVQLAERACQVTGSKEPRMLGTLAAAYAEAGRFEEAVAASEKASVQALALGQQTLALKSQEMLELFKARQPFREK